MSNNGNYDPSKEQDRSGSPGENAGENDAKTKKEQGLWPRIFWTFMSIVSVFWIFYPEPSDLIPVLGWIDEGFAGVLLLTSLSKLGINIPVLNKLLAWRAARK